MKEKTSARKEGSLTIRAFIVYVCVILVAVGIFYRIIDLQFHKNDLKSQSEAAKKTLETVVIPVERGTIFSRNNEILVQRFPKYKIAMDTYPLERIKREGKADSIKVLLSDSLFEAYVPALADSITELFGDTAQKWEKQIRAARAKKEHYFKISDNAGISEYNRAQKIFVFYNGKKKVCNTLCKPEIDLKNAKYPYDDLARRTLGEVRTHVVGKKNPPLQEQDSIERVPVGLEGYFDKELSGTDGSVLKKYISNIAIEIESEDNIKPCNGYDITTTLDMTIQNVATQSLLNNLRSYNADEGCAIVMEVATGDILSIVNISKDKTGKYRETKNIALTKYEPGSTFKTASLLVALNDEKVTPTTPIPINYTLGRTATVGHRAVVDDHALASKSPELWYVFAQSSNVGTARAIYDNYASGQQKFIDGLYKLGFGDTLRFPIIGGDMKPLLRSTSDPKWSKTSISTIPFGYEVEVTPLHLLTFYNAIANNGCMVQPRLVSKISAKDKTIRTFAVDTLNAHICSEQALGYIRGMLDSVVTCGTGRKGFITAPYSVAGKTGTSKILSPDAKGENLYNASFCGYFPADNPKYSCIVVIKKPRTGSIYGGAVALPVFRDIADKIYATDYALMPEAKAMPHNADIASIPISAKVRSKTLANIFTGINFNTPVSSATEWIKVYSDGQSLCMEDVVFSKNIIPDVTGMSLTDAVYILEKAGIATEVKGYGRVKRQSPEANAPLKKNQKVVLELDIES